MATRLKLRPFGYTAEDLLINFDADSPTLVTQIIRLCTVTADDKIPNDKFYWDLEVGKRIECLIRIAISEHSTDIVTVLKCPEQSCEKYLELKLSLNDLLSENGHNSNDDSCSLTLFDKTIKLRKPTGADQLSWLDLDRYNQKESIISIIETLLISDQDYGHICDEVKLFSDEVLERIGEKLSKIDPLIDYKIELQCPLCGIKNHYRLDLENLLLRKLRDKQKELLFIIHTLATNYHWTENEIFAIPSWRRRLYLSVIETDKS